MKRKIVSKFLLGCCVTTSIFSITCCNKGKNPIAQQVIVQFKLSNPESGTVVPVIYNITKGTMLSEITKKANLVVDDNWEFNYYSINGIKVKDETKYVINGDVVVMINCTRKMCKVNLSVYGEGEIYPPGNSYSFNFPKGMNLQHLHYLINPKPDADDGWSFNPNYGYIVNDQLVDLNYPISNDENNIRLYFYNPNKLFNFDIKEDKAVITQILEDYDPTITYIPAKATVADKTYDVSGFDLKTGSWNFDTKPIKWLIFDKDSKIETINDHFILGDTGHGNENIKCVTFSNSVKEIGSFAFYSCSNIESINLSIKLNSIGSSAFGKCSKLKSITIPKSVATLESAAFVKCASLTTIDLSQIDFSVIPSGWNSSAFRIDLDLPKNGQIIINNESQRQMWETWFDSEKIESGAWQIIIKQ